MLPPTATATITPTVTATPALTTTAEVTATLEVTPTEAVTPTPEGDPTATPTQAPTATATPYTREAFEQNYDEVLANFESFGFNENDLRNLVESQLYAEKVMNALLEEQGITPEQDYIWARHILVEDEETANNLRERIENGEDWNELAAEFSTDESNKDRGGDLGWFGPGRMVAPFEEAAFDLEVYEISQPVQSDFGWHIIQVLGRDRRVLSADEYEQLRAQRFQAWLDEQQEASEVEIHESWQANVPEEPDLPIEVQQFINQAGSQQPVVPGGITP
jgi:parvulin-like peptidyl-prolyl isomerase